MKYPIIYNFGLYDQPCIQIFKNPKIFGPFPNFCKALYNLCVDEGNEFYISNFRILTLIFSPNLIKIIQQNKINSLCSQYSLFLALNSFLNTVQQFWHPVYSENLPACQIIINLFVIYKLTRVTKFKILIFGDNLNFCFHSNKDNTRKQKISLFLSMF